MTGKTKQQKEDNNNKTQHKSIDNKDSNPDQVKTDAASATSHKKQKSTGRGTGRKDKAGHKTDRHKDDLRKIEEKLADLQDKYMRLSAEFDNYRKRTLREKIELTKYAGEDLFLKIIPLMDDFDRALDHMNSATDCVAMKNGIELIYGKFCDFLNQNGIKEIESINKVFDVDLHEAVAKVPVEENEKKGKVVDVVLKGYYLQDKVLRFSKVVVGE
jgi:molecular chaperone GrpE